jgi:hypothetical protein
MHARLLPTCTLCVTFMHIPMHMCAKELPAVAACVVLNDLPVSLPLRHAVLTFALAHCTEGVAMGGVRCFMHGWVQLQAECMCTLCDRQGCAVSASADDPGDQHGHEHGSGTVLYCPPGTIQLQSRQAVRRNCSHQLAVDAMSTLLGRCVGPTLCLVLRGICTAQGMDVSGSAAKLCGRLSGALFL